MARIGFALACASIFVMGCAKPVPAPTNVILDSDVEGCLTKTPATFRGGTDVVIVIDTSQSTGHSIEHGSMKEGIRPRHDHAMDRSHSRLAAQVSAARSLVASAAEHDIRFAIVTYAGAGGRGTTGRMGLSWSGRESKRRAALMHDSVRLDEVLAEILDRGPHGSTEFFAGMSRANQILRASRTPNRRRIVLFMSDSSSPTGVGLNGRFESVDPRMRRAALAAKRGKVVFHTFGLSKDSEGWRRKPIGQIAGATGGTYHPVRNSSEFHCHLVDALKSPPAGGEDWERALARFWQLRAEARLESNSAVSRHSP